MGENNMTPSQVCVLCFARVEVGTEKLSMGGEAYSFVACLSRMIIYHASLPENNKT